MLALVEGLLGVVVCNLFRWLGLGNDKLLLVCSYLAALFSNLAVRNQNRWGEPVSNFLVFGHNQRYLVVTKNGFAFR